MKYLILLLSAAFKPGNGVTRTATIRFVVDSDSCNKANFGSSVRSSLTNSLQAVGVCNPSASSTSCDFSMTCESGSNRRRKRAPTDLTVDVTIMSKASDGDTTMDVLTRLDDAVNKVIEAAANGSLSIEVDGEMTTNKQTAFGVSSNTWDCKAGQKSSPDGCCKYSSKLPSIMEPVQKTYVTLNDMEK